MVEMRGFEEQSLGAQGLAGTADDPNLGGAKPRNVHSRRDIIDNLCTSVNQDLLVAKTFYFFFFSAFGSLFPLMAVYFKQLGMNPSQSGILIGFRPLIEFLSAPLWGGLADRYRKGKAMLLFSLFCWIFFTMALAFVQPPASSCVMFNDTHHVLFTPYPDYGTSNNNNKRDKRSATELPAEELDYIELEPSIIMFGNTTENPDQQTTTEKQDFFRGRREGSSNTNRHKPPPGHVVGKSPSSVEYTLNYNQDKHTSYVSPPFSSIVYKWEDVQEVFFLLLLLIVLGEFFSAPAITLADSATLTYLGEDTDNYGKQRMFGSLGWGLAMFFVGIALDQSTAFTEHPCGPHEMERNYTVCFATFSVLMGCAFMSATQFHFDYDAYDQDNIPMKTVQQNGSAESNPTVIAVSTSPVDQDDGPKAAKSTVFAQTTRQLPAWFSVLRTFATVRYGAFLYVTWFMGFGIGLVFTFLFWHLQDLGGTPTLFGVASVINHISEIFAYFFSFKFIRQIGHIKVLCIGLAGNVCRFLYISWLTNPWWVLPFEFIQGITHAAVWAACCSYITQSTPDNLRSSAQGVLQGLHHGLGRGCGAVIGGIFVNYFGTQITFRGYGFACLIVLGLFIMINYYKRDQGFTFFQDEQEPAMVVEETSHLAPHGVPTNPMARSLSRQNLTEQDAKNGNGSTYGSTYSSTTTKDGFLDVSNSHNYPPATGGPYQGQTPGYTTQDMNMNAMKDYYYAGLSRNALAAAFNPKGILAAASSPEARFDYDLLKRDFQAYNEAMVENSKDGYLFSSPQLKTALYTPQPEPREDDMLYEW